MPVKKPVKPKSNANKLGVSQIKYNKAKRSYDLSRAGRMGGKFPSYNVWMKKKK